MTDFRIVFITVPNMEEAKRIANGLVEAHLAACVNIIPGIQSIYRWQGEIQSDAECLLVCKTETSQWDNLSAWVTNHHPYEVPEILQIPVTAGSQAYLQWLSACLEK